MNNSRKELEIAIKQTPDLCVADFKDEILAIVDKFNESGQSGGSAPYYAHAIAETIKKLCLQQPISDLTGSDDEWFCHAFDDETYWQNKRDGAVFMGKDKRPYFLDAIVFRDENGCCFTGMSFGIYCEEIISSRQFFKLPCTPKTFYVDVIDFEDKYYILDESQLEDVFNFYERPLTDRFMSYLQTGKNI